MVFVTSFIGTIMGTQDFQILDSLFTFKNGNSWSEFFIRMNTLYIGAQPPVQGVAIDIHVYTVPYENLLELTREWNVRSFFHRSMNYAHWNLEGVSTHSKVFMPSEAIAFHVDNEASTLNVYLDPDKAQRGSELIYHAARNIALWRRGLRFSCMLHASAVVFNEKTWLFIGDKGAGKSTLFIDSVLRQEATPLANDRVFLDSADGKAIWSWPSYLSYCEGTILDYPELRSIFETARKTATGANTAYGSALYRKKYVQAHKRIVPPFFLKDSLNMSYVRANPIGGIVFACLDPSLKTGLAVQSWRKSDEVKVEEINHAIFSADDPDFPCWHGINGPAMASKDQEEKTMAWLAQANIPVLKITLNPISGKAHLRELLS